MTSALSAPFHGLPIDEAVPLAAEVGGVSRSSILQGRRRIRFQPQTGTSAAPGSIVQFVLSDSTGLLDVNSMVLSATVTVTGATTAEPAWMDEGAAWCRRAQVLLNGSLVEDVDNAHRASNLEVLSSCGDGFYKTQGSFMNYWKFNNDLIAGGAANQATTQKNDVLNHLDVAWADLSGNGSQYAWPLGLITPSLRTEKYWPLRSMGELVLQFTCANASEAVFSPAKNATNPTYALSNIFLECDIVVPLPEYAALLDRVTQMESEPGLVIPVDTLIVSQGQSIPAAQSATATTESSVVVSRATTNLRQAIFAVQPTAGLNNFTYPATSCFPDAGFGAIQWRVGSLYFPSQPADSLGRAAQMTMAAFGHPASVDKSPVWNRQNYDATTTTAAATFRNALSAPGAGGVIATNARFTYADFAPKAYSFDSYKGGEPLDADGISILGQAGSQIVNIVRLANPEAVTPVVVLKATKYLHLKNGGLRVVGA